MGVPTSTALSKPVITAEVKDFHPRPKTANMTTTNKIKPKNPMLEVLSKVSYKDLYQFWYSKSHCKKVTILVDLEDHDALIHSLSANHPFHLKYSSHL
jgi:hypothetical protein